jgi:DNA-directed RNA polymerase subunit L
MKVTNVVENNNEIKFVLNGVDPCIANGLRRTLLSDIPCVVMKTIPHDQCKVNITKNTSKFNNEIIKQRLACIPIHITDLNTPIDQLELELDIENNTEEVMHVTTGDIKIKNIKTSTYLSDDDKRDIFPPNPMTGYYIDIVRLRPRLTPTSPGERITFTANLSIATVDDNSMYNMVSTCCYGNTQDETKVNEQYKIKEQELKDNGVTGDNLELAMKDWTLLDAQRYFIPNSFDFTVKTVGVYTCKELLKIGCERLIEKAKTVKAAIESPGNNKNVDDDAGVSEDPENKTKNDVTIETTASTIQNGYDITIDNEDYTLGTMLQYMVYSSHYEGDKQMTFCGFKKFHPHDTYIMIRIGYKEPTEKSIAAGHMIEGLTNIVSVYENLLNMF